MVKFIYSAWFLDTVAEADDQDKEWAVCIGIKASTAEVAKDWGDTLTSGRMGRFPSDEFIWSSVQREVDVEGVTDWSTLPRIKAGDYATDEEIGW